MMIIDYPPIRQDIPPTWAVRSRARHLVDIAAAGMGVKASEIMGHCRNRELVEARKWVARDLRASGYSLEQIGRALNRDHTTIMHYLKARKRRQA